MKTTSYTLIIGLLYYSSTVYAQDTTSYKNSSWKLGARIVYDRSNNFDVSRFEHEVTNFGLDYYKRINNSPFFYKTGIYKLTHAHDFYFYLITDTLPFLFSSPTYFTFISLPLNIHYKSSLFNFTSGFFVEYLIDKARKITITDRIIPAKIFNERKYNVGFNFASGFEEKIRSKVYFNFELSYVQSLLSINNRIDRLNFSFTNVGIALGVIYKQ